MDMNDTMLPTIALIPGDCTGIGPEQTARILSQGHLAELARLVVVGDAGPGRPSGRLARVRAHRRGGRNDRGGRTGSGYGAWGRGIAGR